MKNKTSTAVSLLLLLGMLLIQSCRENSQKIQESQMEFIQAIQQNDDFIKDVETALAKEEYPKALEIAEKWEDELPHIIRTAKAIKLPKDYAALQKSLIVKLENYKPIIAQSYPALIRLRLQGERSLNEEKNIMLKIQMAYAEMSETYMQLTLLMEKKLSDTEKEFKPRS